MICLLMTSLLSFNEIISSEGLRYSFLILWRNDHENVFSAKQRLCEWCDAAL